MPANVARNGRGSADQLRIKASGLSERLTREATTAPSLSQSSPPAKPRPLSPGQRFWSEAELTPIRSSAWCRIIGNPTLAGELSGLAVNQDSADSFVVLRGYRRFLSG